MSILANLPHVATAKIRSVASGPFGGGRESFTVVFTDMPCWRQNATDREVEEFGRQGIVVTDRFYFTSDPGVDERHILVDVRNKNDAAGSGSTWEVVSRSLPDSGSGLGVVWRVMAKLSTGGSTG